MRGSYLFERHASKCTGRGPLGRSVLKGGRMAAARKSRRGRVRRGRQNGRFLAKFRGGRLPIAIEPDETSRHRYSGMVTRWYRHLVRAPRLSLSHSPISLLLFLLSYAHFFHGQFLSCYFLSLFFFFFNSTFLLRNCRNLEKWTKLKLEIYSKSSRNR